MTVRLCQRPERASFISTNKTGSYVKVVVIGCQRPERASFISTQSTDMETKLNTTGVNALNGLLSFLRKDMK